MFYQGLFDGNEDQPKRSAVAALSYAELKATCGLGKRSLEEVIAWLAEEGLEPSGGLPKKTRASQSRLDEAVALLERHGYTVRKP